MNETQLRERLFDPAADAPQAAGHRSSLLRRAHRALLRSLRRPPSASCWSRPVSPAWSRQGLLHREHWREAIANVLDPCHHVLDAEHQ